jgi:hypothetical protein
MERGNSSSTAVQSRPVPPRQRGQRVFLRIAATLHGAAPDGISFAIPVPTFRITPRGAKISSLRDVPLHTSLILEHNGTHERKPWRIAGAPSPVDGLFHFAIEFEGDAPDFWQIAFPATE